MCRDMKNLQVTPPVFSCCQFVYETSPLSKNKCQINKTQHQINAQVLGSCYMNMYNTYWCIREYSLIHINKYHLYSHMITRPKHLCYIFLTFWNSRLMIRVINKKTGACLGIATLVTRLWRLKRNYLFISVQIFMLIIALLLNGENYIHAVL